MLDTTHVPETSTWPLLTAGLIGLFGYRRRLMSTGRAKKRSINVLSSVLLIGATTLSTGEGRAAIITPPPADWVFQNTENITATDFRVVRAIPLVGQAPDIDLMKSSGGAAFPNKAYDKDAQNMDIKNVVIYTGPPGVLSGGFYAHSFPDWPAGTSFSVLFSYNNDETDLRQPGRVFKRVGGQGLDFELVPDLSPAGPLDGPPPDFAALFAVRGDSAPVPEPATWPSLILGLGIVQVARKVLGQCG
jgi:hypothetical protein